MKIVYLFILQFIFLFCNLLQAQEPQEKWELDSLVSGNKTYIARESITLKPGFTYTASSGNTFTAKIDQTLVFPPAENTYAKPDGTITADPSQGAVVGNLSGAFDVSPTGAATYTVPIEVPAGIQGMQPNISLVYNSQSGNGIAGMCWNIGGLSMISRVPKDYYFDNERSGIIWNNTSPLALDGQRLIIVNNSWGNDSIEYRTESGLDRIVGYNIKLWGPQTFKVYTKDGRILEYGSKTMTSSYYPIRMNTNDIETSKDTYTLGWALARIIDANNNFIDFSYAADVSYLSGYYNYNSIRISSISYGNQTGTTKETVGSVYFIYKARTNSSISYIDGMELSNEYILDNIQTKGGNDLLLDTYQLTYSTLDQKDFLTQIKRTNALGESIQPIKFDWSPMSYSYNYYNSLSFIPTPNFSSYINFGPYCYGDIDGDGLVDLLVRTSTSINGGTNTWIVYRNLGNNTFQKMYEESWDKNNENTFLFLDLDNDGKDELYVGRVKPVNTVSSEYYLNCYKYSVGTFKAYPSGDKSVIVAKSVYDKRSSLYALTGDFMGNGTTQFIIFSSNNTPGFSMGFNTNNIMAFPFGNSSKSKVFLTDLNGNGKPEIAFVNDGTTSFYEYQGNSFVNILTTNQFKYNDYIQVGDFNGDGNSDLLVLNRYSPLKWKVFTSTGKYFIEKDMNSYISSDVSYDKALVVDVNRDGKSDILVETPNFVNGAASTATLKILISNGNSFTSQVLNTNANLTFGPFIMASNFKSGHSQDVYVNFNCVHISPQIISLSANVWFNKINKITDSFGQQLSISYMENKNPYQVQQKMLTETENNIETDKIVNNFLPQLEVVSTLTAPNVNQSYVYANPQIDRKSKGFLGFDTIQITDSARSITTVNESEFNYTYHFLYPYKNTVKTTSGTLISETTQKYTVNNVNKYDNRYFLQPDFLISADYLKGITVNTAYSNYDSDRNPQTINTDYGSGITTTQALTYVSKGSCFLNKISSSQTTQKATGQQDVVRNEYFLYDNKGNPTYHVTDSTDVNKVQTVYSDYDQYGNPKKITTTANGISRSKSMTYCSSGRFLKTETDNQFNETTTYNYDEARGLLTNQIDRLGTTSFQYDSFGRLKLTTYPDGIKTADALQWAGTIQGKPDNAKYYAYTETSGQSPVWVWYDGLGRELRRDSYGLNNKKIMVDTKYYTSGASMGRIYQVSDPYFENTAPPYATTYTYDSYGRISSMLNPMGTTTYGYNKLTDSIISPEGIRKTTINNAGWTTVEETNGKKVNFDYYASGLVKTATPEGGQPLSMEYDLQGNRTKLTDPDAGVITSKYDGWGQLTWEKQAIHNSSLITTDYQYYPSGLLQYKLLNGEKTNYGYDNLYRLKWISIAGKHAQGFVYDQYDRIIQQNDTVESSKVFVNKTDYDQLGRVSKETYPSGYSTTNQYDKYSNLTSVKDRSDRLIWQTLQENARGQLTSELRGNKLVQYNFDNKGQLTNFNKNDGGIDYSFSYYPNGNLHWRSDADTDMDTYEQFVYDSQNRLDNWTVYRNDVPYNYSMTYDPITGNIDTKSDLGNLTLSYGANGKPHALTSISGVPSQLPTDSLRVTYTDFKKIKTLTQGNKFYTLTYGVDEQRRKSEYKLNNATQETRYYLGDYEEVTNTVGITQKIHYLSSGAILIMTGNVETMYYGYYDHLGSLIALANEQGQVVERYAYDPWGNRRNPMNWTQPDTRTSWLVNRGFTGHEHLDAFGIINMNGRVYDPLTAMFFSPDPYVQAPENWLNYNRYTYCLNNPLIYIDPSGEYAIIDDLIAAALGGTINVIVNAFQGNIHSWGQGFSYFGVGAAGTWVGLYAGPVVSGLIIGAGNNFVSQGFGSSGNWNWNNINYSQVAMNGIMGAGMGFISSELSGYISPYANKLFSGIGGQALRQAAVQGTVGAGSGFVIGTGAALLDGESLGDALKAGGKSALTSAAIGTASGIATGMRSAYKDGTNAWNGNFKFKDTPAVTDYNLNPNSSGDNVTLYRGTTGSESDNGYLFMTDDPNYAASYVANGGKVVEITIPRNTLNLMKTYGLLQTSTQPQYHINGTSGIEYRFESTIKPYIVSHFK